MRNNNCERALDSGSLRRTCRAPPQHGHVLLAGAMRHGHRHSHDAGSRSHVPPGQHAIWTPHRRLAPAGAACYVFCAVRVGILPLLGERAALLAAATVFFVVVCARRPHLFALGQHGVELRVVCGRRPGLRRRGRDRAGRALLLGVQRTRRALRPPLPVHGRLHRCGQLPLLLALRAALHARLRLRGGALRTALLRVRAPSAHDTAARPHAHRAAQRGGVPRHGRTLTSHAARGSRLRVARLPRHAAPRPARQRSDGGHFWEGSAASLDSARRALLPL